MLRFDGDTRRAAEEEAGEEIHLHCTVCQKEPLYKHGNFLLHVLTAKFTT